MADIVSIEISDIETRALGDQSVILAKGSVKSSSLSITGTVGLSVAADGSADTKIVKVQNLSLAKDVWASVGNPPTPDKPGNRRAVMARNEFEATIDTGESVGIIEIA